MKSHKFFTAVLVFVLVCFSGCAAKNDKDRARALKSGEAEKLLAMHASKEESMTGRTSSQFRPKDPKEQERHADQLARKGEYLAALFQYQRIVVSGNDAQRQRARAKAARICLLLGQHQQAEYLFSRLIKKRPDDPDMLEGLGMARLGMNQLDKAQAALKQAVAIEPKLWRSQNALGIINNRRLAPNEALLYLNKAIDIMPSHHALYNNRAISHILNGDINKAETDLRSALELAPDYKLAMNNLALVLVRQKKERQALKVLSESQGEARAQHDIALMLLWEGDKKSSQKYLNLALEGMPRYYPKAAHHLDIINSAKSIKSHPKNTRKKIKTSKRKPKSKKNIISKTDKFKSAKRTKPTQPEKAIHTKNTGIKTKKTIMRKSGLHFSKIKYPRLKKYSMETKQNQASDPKKQALRIKWGLPNTVNLKYNFSNQGMKVWADSTEPSDKAK